MIPQPAARMWRMEYGLNQEKGLPKTTRSVDLGPLTTSEQWIEV